MMIGRLLIVRILVAVCVVAALATVPAAGASASVVAKSKPKNSSKKSAKPSVNLTVTGAQTATLTDASSLSCSLGATGAPSGAVGADSKSFDTNSTKNTVHMEIHSNGFVDGKMGVGSNVYSAGVSAPTSVMTLSGKTFTLTAVPFSGSAGSVRGKWNGRLQVTDRFPS